MKKEKQKIYKKNISSEKENNKRTIIIVASVLFIFVAFILITHFFVKKETKLSVTPATIQYKEITINTIKTRNYNSYYVLVIHEEDENKALLETIQSEYATEPEKLPVLKTIIENPFNTNYIANESNLTNDLAELKFNTTTLVKIENKEIVGFYEGIYAIKEELK